MGLPESWTAPFSHNEVREMAERITLEDGSTVLTCDRELIEKSRVPKKAAKDKPKEVKDDGGDNLSREAVRAPGDPGD